jgi:PadR family transcriptional regulator PadR
MRTHTNDRLQGTLDLRAEWGASENNRRAPCYSITAAGRRQLTEEEQNWAQLTEGVARVLRFV